MRIVVLDDYQQVAGEFADWSGLDAEVEFISRPIVDDDDFVKVLTGAEVVRPQRRSMSIPCSPVGRGPNMRRSSSAMARSLMLASRRDMSPSAVNSHSSLP